MKNLFFLLFFISFYSFSQDSLQVSKPKLSVVAADKINVVYRGIDNPISIAVNNVKSYKIYGDNVKQNKDGKYIIKPGIGLETKVFVEIINMDDSITTEEHVFRIKGLPSPIGTIKGEFSTQSSLELSIEELKDAEVGLKFIDFLFPFNFKVTQFNLKVPGFPSLVISGNIITNEAYELLKKAKKKDYIIISDIKTNYMMSENVCYKAITPIFFKIIK